MAHVIAVAGKGGVGKTTLCGMLIQYLCEKKKGPVLAVDADANSNLNEVLGVEVYEFGDKAPLVKKQPEAVHLQSNSILFPAFFPSQEDHNHLPL